MLTLFEYMQKISATYVVVYLFYWVVLRHLTNYKSNRYYFIIMLAFAFIIPFIKFGVFINMQTISGSAVINYIPSLNITNSANGYIPAKSIIDISLMVLIVFLGGILVCIARFLMQLLSVRKIISKASLADIKSGVKLYHLDMDVVPFSFANAIYVNRHKHTLTELHDIIKHESVHIKQKHIVDVMLAEFVCILNWYNPFVWLIKNAMKQNLEFLADDMVINNGTDKKSYQYLLLSVTGYTPMNIVSSFKLSSLKQRIYMMNKTRTSQKHLLKLFFVLPLLIITMLAFRDNNSHASNITHNVVKEDTFMLSELTYNIPDENVNIIVRQAQNKSLLQVGKPFTIKLVIDERDRLKSLLEKNGYNNIGNHAIVFMLDSSLSNNHLAVEVNIDLKRQSSSFNNTNKKTGAATTADYFNQKTQHHYYTSASPLAITEQQVVFKT